MKATSIVLAGGKNLRLGRIKALEVVGGKSLIGRVIERLAPVTDRLMIVTSPEQKEQLVNINAEMLLDIYPGKGPLGGIYTGLAATQSLQNIAVACDMPFLNGKLLEHMVGLLDDFDAVVPRLKNGLIEPLHSIYSNNCLERIKTRLVNNQLGITRFVRQELRVRYIEEEECRKFDPELLSFFNINRQPDLDKAIKIADDES